LSIQTVLTHLFHNPSSWRLNYYDGALLAKDWIVAHIILALRPELGYGWRIPGLPGFDTVCFLRPQSYYSRSHLCIPSDAPENPAMHAIFLFLFVVFMLATFCTAYCDPGICATLPKDALKSVREFRPLPHQENCTKAVVHPFDIPYRISKILFEETTWVQKGFVSNAWWASPSDMAYFALMLHFGGQTIKPPHTRHCSFCNRCVTYCGAMTV
jgi:hypothetical protein